MAESINNYYIKPPTVDKSKIPHDFIIRHNDPSSLKKAVEVIGGFYNRELSIDYITFASKYIEKNRVAYIWTEEAYQRRTQEVKVVVIGVCLFEWKNYNKRPIEWELSWVWFHPNERGKGHLSRDWEKLKNLFPGFSVKGPLNAAMDNFLKKNDPEIKVVGPLRGEQSCRFSFEDK